MHSFSYHLSIVVIYIADDNKDENVSICLVVSQLENKGDKFCKYHFKYASFHIVSMIIEIDNRFKTFIYL